MGTATRSAVLVGVLFAVLIALSTGCVTAVAALQPKNIGVPILTLTTSADDGSTTDRVLARIEDDGRLYVSANHWPRAWYHRALENPNVQVTIDEDKQDYLAVPIVGAERARLREDFGLPFLARVLTGFPPRDFLRLDPKPVQGEGSDPPAAE